MNTAPISAPAKVLFAIPTMGLGGSERVVLNLLRHLTRSQFEPHLAVLEAVGANLGAVPADVQVHVLGVRHARNAILPLAALCWKIGPQVVLSTSAHLNTAVLAARKLMPRGAVVLIRQGADLFSTAVNYSRIRLLACKQLYRRAHALICQSDYMKQDLIRRLELAPSQVVRIYNPVDIASVAELAVAAPNPLGDPGPNLVSVGRLSYEKGYDLLLEGFACVREAFASASLTVIGDGPDLSALKALRRDLGLERCVRFFGPLSNPFPFIKHADLFVLPSRSEALPNVVLEALALGTPVVASNCTQALWEIAACTERLRIASDITAEALTREIVSFLAAGSTPRKHGPEPQFVAKFGVRTVVDQYEQLILRKLTGRQSVPSRRTEVCAE